MNKNIIELCKKNNIVIKKMSFINKIIIIESNNNNYFCKKKDINYVDIEKYGIYIPTLIDEVDSYQLYLYDNSVFDLEQKSKRLINTLLEIYNSSLKIIEYTYSQYDNLYNEISLNIKSVRDYYLEIQDYIESFTFPKLYYYFLLINISSFYNILDYAQYYLEKWYTKKNRNIYLGLTIGNVNLNNFCCGKGDYFLDLSSCAITNIIYDIVNFYKNEVLNVDVFEVIDNYFSFVEIDRDLFFAFICIPRMINFSDNNYDDILKIRKEINYINKTLNYVSEKNKENEETN